MTEYVRRTGTIFRCGNYADKGFALNADEARAAIAAFTPVPVDLEHIPTVLSDRLGTLESVQMHADGETLVGTVALPSWLDSLLGDDERRVSATWNRATKQLAGLAIVRTPRVSDAALFAAFSDTEEGKALVSMEAEFVSKRHNATDQTLIEKGHKMAHAVAGIFVGLGATPAPAEGSPQEEAGETPATEAAETTAGMSKGAAGMTDEKKARTFGDKFAAWFSGEDVTADDRAAVEARFRAETPVTVREVVEAAPKPDPEKDAMRREIARLRERDVERDAAAFADGEVAAKRALPGERDALVAEFTQAAHDDLANPATVTFSVGDETKTGNRVDAVRARHAIRLPHRLTEELVKNITEDEHIVLMSAMQTRQAGTEAKPSDERMRRLNEASPLGRASLAAKK